MRGRARSGPPGWSPARRPGCRRRAAPGSASGTRATAPAAAQGVAHGHHAQRQCHCARLLHGQRLAQCPSEAPASQLPLRTARAACRRSLRSIVPLLGSLRRGASQLAFMEVIAGAPGARKRLPPPACSPGPDCCACRGCSWGVAGVLAEVLAEVAEVLCSRQSRRYMSK